MQEERDASEFPSALVPTTAKEPSHQSAVGHRGSHLRTVVERASPYGKAHPPLTTLCNPVRFQVEPVKGTGNTVREDAMQAAVVVVMAATMCSGIIVTKYDVLI
jgi:hypothetical protein